jgi:hypothetical protein
MPVLPSISLHRLGVKCVPIPQETVQPSFVVVDDPSLYKAAGVKADPPAVAHRSIQGVKPKVTGLRFTMESAPVALHKHAARQAFKACTVPMLRKLTYKLRCEFEGHRPKKEDELAEACISACLPELSASEVKEIVKIRHKSRKDTQFECFAGTVADVANVEGTEKLFDEMDAKEFSEDIKRAREKLAGQRNPRPGAGQGGGAAPSSSKLLGGLHPIPEGEPTGAAFWAKTWIPQVKGCTLFKDTKRHNRWVVHYPRTTPPFSFSKAWGSGGVVTSRECWLRCIQWAWDQHTSAGGEPCPFRLE